MNCIKYLLLIALIGYGISSKAQNTPATGNAHITELQKQLQGQKEDTDKIKTLNDIAFEYNRISPNDGIRYAKQSIALAEKIKWEKGLARANSCMGANYYSLSDYPNAYKYWLVALDINERIGNKIGVANHQHNIGNIYFSEKNYPLALSYYEMGLKSSEEIGNKPILTNSYTSIGNVYGRLRDYPKALEYYANALTIDESQNAKGNIAADEINIGEIYNEQGKYNEALQVLAKAIAIKTTMGDKNGLANAFNTTGEVFLRMAGDSAPLYIATRHNSLLKARSYLDSAITIDKEIGYLDNMQKSYAYLSDALEKMNDDKGALQAYKQFTAINDSIYSQQKLTNIFNLQKKEEIEAQNREQEKAENEKERKEYIQMGGICLFIVLLISVILLIRRKKVNPVVIDLLCTFTLLVFFEFINLLLNGKIEKITNHNIALTLLCILGVAVIIIPVHHKMEHWMKKKIGHKK